jgi:hypothetical protein
MVTEIGKKIKEFAEKMAKSPNGTSEIYESVANTRGLPEGTPMVAVKDRDGGQRAGLDYSLEALGARKARGDDVEEETKLLIKRAKKLKIKRPADTVRSTIYAWQRNAEFADKKKNEDK